MKYFKITRTWSVEAEDEAEAFHQIATDPNEHLESETVARTEYKRPKQETGWAAGFAASSPAQVVSVERSRLPPTRELGGSGESLNERVLSGFCLSRKGVYP